MIIRPSRNNLSDDNNLGKEIIIYFLQDHKEFLTDEEKWDKYAQARYSHHRLGKDLYA